MRVCLFVGRFGEPRKGFPVLLDALAILREEGRAVEAEVVGEGSWARHAARAAALGVRFRGRLADAALAERYRAADVLCAPSLRCESFGMARLVLEVDGVGRVLVAHGHAQDPVSASPLGRLGDAVSRRLGRLAVVRGAAHAVEAAARGIAGARMAAVFRARCLAEVERGGFDLGVFGHVHRPHAVPGDRYANAGALAGRSLSYLALDRAGPRVAALRA